MKLECVYINNREILSKFNHHNCSLYQIIIDFGF